MPAQQRRGRNQERVPAGAREQSTRGCQEDPVYGRDRRPTGLTPKDRELVSQHQDPQDPSEIRDHIAAPAG